MSLVWLRIRKFTLCWAIAILATTNGFCDTSTIDQLNQKAYKYLKERKEGALPLINQALNLSIAKRYPQGLSFAYNNQGIYYHNVGKSDSAYTSFSKAFTIYQSISDSLHMSHSLSNMGNIRYYSGNYKEALILYKQAREHLKPEYRHDYMALSSRIAMVQMVWGNYTEALKVLIAAGSLAEDTLDPVLNENYLLTASAYLSLKDYKLSERYFLKAIVGLEKTGEIRKLSEAYNNMGNLYMEKGQVSQAIKVYMQSLDLCKKQNDLRGIAACYNNIGMVFQEQQNYIKSLYYYNLSLKIKSKIGDLRGRIFPLLSISSILIETSKPQQAIEAAKEALLVSQQFGATNEECKANQILSQAYCNLNDYKQAYYYQYQYAKQKDTLFSYEKAKTVAELSSSFENKEREQQLAIQKQRISILSKEKFISKLTGQVAILVAILILLVSGILVNWLLKKNRKSTKVVEESAEKLEIAVQLHEAQMLLAEVERRSLVQELEYNKNTLKNFALQIVQKDDFIKALDDEINKLSKSLGKDDGKAQVKQLSTLIKSQFRLDQEMVEFHSELEKVSKTFLDQLSHQFDDLTDDEKKLCVYLRLNLSSKEISTLFGISPKSVDMKRFRLRKKIGLASDTSLYDFLKSY
jgi:tetratricopeptide (TPR) repeat protein